MIYLTANTINSVYLTLSESITLTASPIYFLFRLVNETTRDEVLFFADDISTNKIRYNKFNITLTGASSINVYDGIINLEPTGKWQYYIYNTNSQTLSVPNQDPIELGYALVNSNPNQQYNYTGQTETFFFYDPSNN